MPASPTSDDLTHRALKARHRAIREGLPQDLNLRVHRALSWLDRAEQLAEAGDPDGQVIFLWIAFNAAYARDMDQQVMLSEQEAFRTFTQAILSLDAANRRLENLVWKEFPGSIRMLLDNPYVFPRFWDYHRGEVTHEVYAHDFEQAKAQAHKALGTGQTERVLTLVLGRVYTLRNQLVHGGATWRSSVNRDQIRDTARFLARLVPLVIALMMDHPQKAWGAPAWPVVS